MVHETPLGANSPGEKEKQMSSGFNSWRKRYSSRGCGPAADDCGSWEDMIGGFVSEAAESVAESVAGNVAGVAGGVFGVRRPLRFMTRALGLDEEQVAEMAAIMDELKTERAQAAVDQRRASAAFADAMEGASFDRKKASTAAAARVESAQRVQEIVEKTLFRTHAILEPEQRKKLAYLLRSGQLTI